jgi:hypothetical protein
MSIGLHIRHGSPQWWESPDIWVVPGQDPNGPPGSPVVGKTAFLWARVWADQNVQGVQLDFWVANPAMQIRKSTANHIGTAFADIQAPGPQEVLCLAPWNVTLLNGGHECVIVEASSPQDPLTPPPTDPDVLDANTYPQIAQRNLSVIPLSGQQLRREVLLTVTAGLRASKRVEIRVEVGGELPEQTLASLGLSDHKPVVREIRATLSGQSLCHASDDAAERELGLDVPMGTSKPVYINVSAAEPLRPGEYGLVRVTEEDHDGVLGGLTLIAANTERKKR